MSLDDTTFAAGAVLLIEATITDSKTGIAPDPLPDIVMVHIYKPDTIGYVEVDAGQQMDHDIGGTFFTSYQTPADGPRGRWKTQISMHFPDGSTDLTRREATFSVVA
jgi:hypothetical protein